MTSISQFHNQYPVSSSSSEMESNLDASSDLSSTPYPSSSFAIAKDSDLGMQNLATTKSTNITSTTSATSTNPTTLRALCKPADDDLAFEGEYSDDDEQDLPLLDEPEHVLDDEEDDPDDEVPIAVRLTTDTQTLELFNTASSVQAASSHGSSSQSDNASSVLLFHDQGHLFREPLHLFMETLQAQLGIMNDISLYFPQLQLKFHTHMPFSESLSLLDLSFLASKADSECDNVLCMTLSEESNNFVDQYNRLLDLADDGTESEDEDEEDDDDQANTEGRTLTANGEALLVKRSREGASEENAKRQRLEQK